MIWVTSGWFARAHQGPCKQERSRRTRSVEKIRLAEHNWRQILTHLRQDHANRATWGARSFGAAPHKPLLLLAVCDLAEEGKLTTNVIPFEGAVAEGLAESFQSYFKALFPNQPGVLRFPRWAPRTDGVWNLQRRPAVQESAVRPSDLVEIRRRYLGAGFDEALCA